MRNWSPISCSGSRSAARSIPRTMILSGYLGSADNRRRGRGFRRARQGQKSRAALLLRSRARGSRPRPVRPRRHPAAGARPAVSARRYHHAQSFRVRMAVRGEGRDDRSGDRGGARVHGARATTVVVTSAELADTPEGEIETLAVERAEAPGACARQNCRSARTAPAICLPRCWSPRASAAPTRRMR